MAGYKIPSKIANMLGFGLKDRIINLIDKAKNRKYLSRALNFSGNLFNN